MQALAKQEVGDFLSKHFVAVYDKVGTFQVNVDENGKPNRNGGNVAAFFCTPNGFVIHVAAGPRTAEGFLAEAKWSVETYKKILGDRSLGRAQARAAGVSRVTAALRQAHSDAFELMKNPNLSSPGRELVLHLPPSDPRLHGLDTAGKKQRQKVHQIMKGRAYEQLTVVGPVVYTTVLGERLSNEPVLLTGEQEARQGARTGQTLSQFYAEGGAATIAPPAPPGESSSPSGQSKKPERPTRKQ